MISFLEMKYYAIKTRVFFRKKFYSIGNASVIVRPLQIDNPETIKVGDNVYIAHFAWLMGKKNGKKITISIGDNTCIGHFSHIIGLHHVEIGKSVLIADKTFITDCSHNYEEYGIPIIEQGIRRIGEVTIGDGTWIGENVCILGASIGKHCIIGANSVVKSDIPDYCVAVGNPAKVLKRFSFLDHKWLREVQ